MLLANKKCSKCESSYDIVEDTCPFCGAHNEEFETRKVPKQHVWLPIYKELIIFAFGIILLNIISEVMALLLRDKFTDQVAFVTLINGVRYGVVAIAIACMLIGGYKKLANSFNKWLPYVVGISAGFLLIGFNMAYSMVLNLFIKTTTNENQTLANAMVKNYPLLSILILVFIGPAVEEFTYRVGLFSFLSRINKNLAYALTIVIFALIHFDFFATGADMVNELVHLPVYVVSGATLCVLYDLMGLSASWSAHFVNNLISVLPSMLLLSIK